MVPVCVHACVFVYEGAGIKINAPSVEPALAVSVHTSVCYHLRGNPWSICHRFRQSGLEQTLLIPPYCNHANRNFRQEAYVFALYTASWPFQTKT